MAEWRKVTNVIGETGAPDREESVYEFGAEIDGTWVPYGTKQAGYIDHLIANQKARDEQAAKDNPPTTSTETQSTEGQ